ncbi:MAG: ABC transporter ATP-binding protein [Candidatus Marinimicrobia bacterium]|jgi:ABC-2 type transport system ATP-binding protein|nr:ABC transporter ATP-binding protein [Candidatus Neomarinimicrobiota bacterium]MBT3631125.1 ABC transporter ATP-binding protein [Candidatus Neomarinimicrobiota bacterium]MBT3825765.1 ABC transporter ATP-binding protein [Candidatus Neomarinimicrobiota bacterium]MBT4130491.1 ABC transporter ATP-binding protein [Candidatus Neomarinimicrobiota bacterium]MBT4297068.1 ABC transporter ATP-binding protein [Candidatus Neomarinimicrobiota bacterium]
MIKIENLSKQFATTLAVNKLDLHIEKGELFSFLGPNGAGKTTTIKMMVGLMTPSQGMIHMGGFNVEKEPQKAKFITGYVPDSAFLYQHLSGLELLMMVGQLYSMDNKTIENELGGLSERLFMKEWIGDRISGYSQGMKQRLAFASAFLHSPDILIIDEPMVGLDPKTARIIKDMLKERSRSGVTVFISTHNLNVAEELSDRIAIINRGKLLGLGTVDSFQSVSGEQENLEERFLRIVEEEELTEGHNVIEDE